MLRRQAIVQLSLIATAILAASGARAQNSSPAKKLALLLPPRKGSFSRVTAPLLAGMKAAQSRDESGITMDVYAVDEQNDSLASVYREISGKGYDLAVGPLPRDSVSQLSEIRNLSVRTLALNWPEQDRPPAANTVYFGLPIESEATYLARAAFADASAASNRRPLKATIISATSPLARRASNAFADAWKAQGALLNDTIETDTRLSSELRSLVGTLESDLYFVAASIETARSVKNAVPKETLLYGPSLLSTGVTSRNVGQTTSMRMPELDGYRVTELPWLVQTDHPAVMAYPRQATLSHQELQRIYALGIDAFRVARELVSGHDSFELDGVTGRLKMEKGGSAFVQRTPSLAEYRGGLLVPLERT